MNYCVLITDGYVSGIASSVNQLPHPITETEKNEIFSILCNKPPAPDGYDFKLKADSLKWVMVELPPDPGDDATEADYQNALEQMGVNFDADH